MVKCYNSSVTNEQAPAVTLSIEGYMPRTGQEGAPITFAHVPRLASLAPNQTVRGSIPWAFAIIQSVILCNVPDKLFT